MARAKRKKPYNAAKIHDRRSRDLLRNAEVAAIEVDDPLGLDPGDKIVTLRSIRNDPLARLHTHRQIDEAQYHGGCPRAIRVHLGDQLRAHGTSTGVTSVGGCGPLAGSAPPQPFNKSKTENHHKANGCCVLNGFIGMLTMSGSQLDASRAMHQAAPIRKRRR
jgi:hypothetical protein